VFPYSGALLFDIFPRHARDYINCWVPKTSALIR
jgi:hypothetical protein